MKDQPKAGYDLDPMIIVTGAVLPPARLFAFWLCVLVLVFLFSAGLVMRVGVMALWQGYLASLIICLVAAWLIGFWVWKRMILRFREKTGRPLTFWRLFGLSMLVNVSLPALIAALESLRLVWIEVSLILDETRLTALQIFWRSLSQFLSSWILQYFAALSASVIGIPLIFVLAYILLRRTRTTQ